MTIKSVSFSACKNRSIQAVAAFVEKFMNMPLSRQAV
jgi:hypothetical protein